MSVYRIVKEKDKHYIEKKILLWWRKVPDSGLGWGLKQMCFISGIKNKNVCDRILKEYYCG